MLELAEVSAGYGAVAVIERVSLTVGPGEIVALLGPNGAGKTTTLRTIAGLLRPRAGVLSWDGATLAGREPEAIVALGIQFIPEGGGVLRGLTVLENLRLSTWLDRSASLDRAFEVFPVLADRRRQAASTLSGGERQMLALAQALVGRAKLVLIDEASLGLAPVLVERLFEAVARLRDEGRSVLLVEQNAHAALDVADRGFVMEKGRIVEAGPARKLATHGRLAGLYMGELDAEDAPPKARRRARK